jgi:hypothetical protein
MGVVRAYLALTTLLISGLGTKHEGGEKPMQSSLQVQNLEPDPATGVTVTDQLPKSVDVNTFPPSPAR